MKLSENDRRSLLAATRPSSGEPRPPKLVLSISDYLRQVEQMSRLFPSTKPVRFVGTVWKL
jgi:hypothetical protein